MSEELPNSNGAAIPEVSSSAAGSLPITLTWHRGPALGGEGTAGVNENGVSQWYDSDTLLIVVDVDGGREYAVVHISADEDYFHVRDASTGESYDAWGPESWSWWARLTDGALPPREENTKPRNLGTKDVNET